MRSISSSSSRVTHHCIAQKDARTTVRTVLQHHGWCFMEKEPGFELHPTIKYCAPFYLKENRSRYKASSDRSFQCCFVKESIRLSRQDWPRSWLFQPHHLIEMTMSPRFYCPTRMAVDERSSTRHAPSTWTISFTQFHRQCERVDKNRQSCKVRSNVYDVSTMEHAETCALNHSSQKETQRAANCRASKEP